MSAVQRLFQEWYAEEHPPGIHLDDPAFATDELAEAFAAGWEACYHARWEKVGGLPLGDSLKESQE